MDTLSQSNHARLQVFGTTELLEAIILEIDDDYSILRAQRVDSTFGAYIQNSPLIQERLWLKQLGDKNELQQDLKLNPLIFKGGRTSTIYQNLTELTLRSVGLAQGFWYWGGLSPKIEFHQIDVKRCEMAMDESNGSFLSMYLQRPAAQPVKLLISGLYRPAHLHGNWNHAHTVVKQQPFGDLIALALSLRLLADHMQKTTWTIPCPLPYSQNTEDTELIQPKKEVWEAFFTAEQRAMMLSVPFISNR